jgi:triacylglycerol lipase
MGHSIVNSASGSIYLRVVVGAWQHVGNALGMCMKRSIWVPVLFVLVVAASVWSCAEEVEPLRREGVVLLHGLTRSSRSMRRLERRLLRAGYTVANIDYPSREKSIEALAEPTIEKGLALCRKAKVERIHFVTHSMGGILLRYYLHESQIPELGRVVMLSPPNQGSEVTDAIGHLAVYRWLNGPAGDQLGTVTNSMPQQLGAIDAELGVITGDRSINWILSTMIPGPDDGKVSLESAKVAGMDDYRVMPVSHPFIMRDGEVIEEVLYFLAHGCFRPQPDGGESEK